MRQENIPIYFGIFTFNNSLQYYALKNILEKIYLNISLGKKMTTGSIRRKLYNKITNK